jgi:hypothetical protein
MQLFIQGPAVAKGRRREKKNQKVFPIKKYLGTEQMFIHDYNHPSSPIN